MSVALIIGAGEAVGRASAEKFAAAGYEVAVASRSQKLDPAKFPFFKFDATDPTQIVSLFEKVHKEVGVPSVVIYNAAAVGKAGQVTPFDFDTAEAFQKGMNVNAISPAVAAREAVKGFLELEAQGKLGSGGGTYLFTGNALNDKPLPGLFTLGVGKNTTAATVEYLARTAYNDKPFSFYYVDERGSNGRPMYEGVNGDAHADVFLQLAQDPKQGPWQYTFSRDNGYSAFPKDFPSKDSP
ncbi:hypothetical protein F5B22DRAFT_642397 [Xylaria bambusicola]|uniref:uncharacterized protein n=1 Tax=Xylaria bambusicola TaxID=326684 RepID=UPI002008B5CE|nr:uncharacterized protein F5B22DRAFT_642397 [Xylaria bambusicola]KAI0525379.1 hypothetical protein F5B22DRAFT_642397 [Xylaria bambusicola]